MAPPLALANGRYRAAHHEEGTGLCQEESVAMLAVLRRLPPFVRYYDRAEPCSSTSVRSEAREGETVATSPGAARVVPAPFLHGRTRMSTLPIRMGGWLPLAVGGSPAAAGGTAAW